MPDYEQLTESLKTITNWCIISLMLIHQGEYSLLPSVLEQLCVDAEGIVDDYCVVEDCDAIREGK